ncbi:UDP-N-acetylmuramate dehydrogenase [Shimwellia blattae]|uniref:UDP-N-acetylenolpyruvoylglucosamine reductase n=1 Tax=Shimwellia blattae (strain ATCC 29907 / DSM 4481 / JCM 1650 / NBRC 105725 / CDC 9005-74) TaxID=630626 RepID=I2BE26_SHIBC|nr:UDP-N-acetylmuramate dehydrogenase [Shimwellia blattae]AFJ48780.1 UDP-N-acetylenolpyruvoylglucosamine reductase [Shimwellia blattae DSM 4481 = NBRC 105725]GAB83225.1 UDP-N-acetylenolpyruvoylglucosamine reductase [Shimwellia blattae DSM 4481 = NBRC 105725]VDY66265.1 UDP-N-acetylenolpyruvoylglucosamine reductase [Shimwellia blattae]VEC27575.1 UDP-N-acetylenolpyruvoylglucosamine reductase [Shimwellia blattae]
MTISLKTLNTFNLQATARNLVQASTPAQLSAAWQQATAADLPVLILGGGSNVLFLDDFSGTVILNRIEGIEVTDKDDAWHLHVGAGENWHQLVEYTLERNMPGLENLALIPGCAGSAPIQNIGAYGIEIKHVCDYVECVELATGEVVRLSAAECRFGYRDSIFKHEYQDRYAITALGLRLPKAWQPVLSYGDLTRLTRETVTPQQVFDAVCHMRMTRLPDPKIQGNAGSFFKNPVVSERAAATLLRDYPGAPHYPQPDGQVKLAAGWLIDRCELKGFRMGGAAVHSQQALVLVNMDNATSLDVVQLAHEVRQRVGDKFGIWLEPEVRFIGPQGEVSAVETIS